eukprot:CFRG6855T1
MYTINDIPPSVMALSTLDDTFLYPLACIGICMGIRQAEGGKRTTDLFSITSPLASGVSNILCCIMGQISVSILLGIPIISFQAGDFMVGVPALAWYAVNHSPGDLIWELLNDPTILHLLSMISSHRRVRNSLVGLNMAKDAFPRSRTAWVLGGVLYSTSGVYVQALYQHIRGIATSKNKSTIITRRTFTYSVIFCLCLLNVLNIEVKLALVTLVYYELFNGIISYFMGTDFDPLQPVHNLVSFSAFGETPRWFTSPSEEKIALEDDEDDLPIAMKTRQSARQRKAVDTFDSNDKSAPSHRARRSETLSRESTPVPGPTPQPKSPHTPAARTKNSAMKTSTSTKKGESSAVRTKERVTRSRVKPE